MRSDKTAPMTNAQRQRKHRDKRRRELAALRAVVPSSQNERELAAQVRRLVAQIDKATHTAAAQQARIAALEAEQGDAQTVRAALGTLLPKLTPAAQHVVRAHLAGCGAAQWLSPPAAPGQPAAAQPSLSPYLFF